MRHGEIGQQEVVGLRVTFKQLPGLDRVTAGLHGVAKIFKAQLGGDSHCLLVVHQQHMALPLAACFGFRFLFRARIDRFAVDRQIEVEPRAHIQLAFGEDGAPVLLHNSMHHGKAHAGALTHIFRGKKWLPNAVQGGRIHAATLILDTVAHVAPRTQRRHAPCHGGVHLHLAQVMVNDPRPAVHGVLRVRAEIDDNLLDFTGVSIDAHIADLNIRLETDRGWNRGSHQPQGLLENRFGHQWLKLGIRPPAEHQNLLH